MKSLLFIFFVFSATVLHAQVKKPMVEFSLAAGIQSTDMRWSIAGNLNGQSPNILSEIKWYALRGPVVNSELKINLPGGWFLIGNYAKYNVKSGRATDTDYAQDGQQEPTYHAELKSNDGNLSNFGISAGYTLLRHERFEVAVMAGYTGKNENLLLLDDAAVADGETALHSVYKTFWKGISTAVSAEYRVTAKLKLRTLLTYNHLNYHALADWNLIYAFQHPLSFEQKAIGYELGALLGCSYQIKPYLLLNARGGYAYAAAGKGIDKLYLDDGSTQTTQFNGAVKNAINFSLGFTLSF